MSTLRDTARSYADEIRDGIAWVAVWKTGRSWNARAFWLNCDTDQFEADDLPEVLAILEADPAAVLLNGYYCGHFGEDMTADEIAAGIRWHYENGHNLLDDSTALALEATSEQPEAAEANQSTEVTIRINQEQARIIIDEVSQNITRAAEAVCELWEKIAQALTPAVKALAKQIDRFMDQLLFWANDTPKWWHYYKHAKKARTRKKYRKRLMQQLTEKLEAANEGMEVIT